ncbi:MAG: YbaK/EbsC family protein [archaeon]
MHETALKFKEQVLEEYEFEIDVHKFPEGTKTAKGAAKAIGCNVSQIGKNIVMKVEDDLVVVITSGSNRVSEKKLANIFNVSDSNVRTANPNEIKEKTGWSIGGVPPFCHKEKIKVLLDEKLTEFEEVWTAAGTPNTVFPISPQKLIEFSNAEVADIGK